MSNDPITNPLDNADVKASVKAVFELAFQLGALWAAGLPHPALNDDRHRKKCAAHSFETDFVAVMELIHKQDKKAASTAAELLADVFGHAEKKP